MTTQLNPWVRGRGLARILTQETNISDLVQFLSDRDLSPWKDLVGFTPTEVRREDRRSNLADLLLAGEGREAVIEVKLGHLMSIEQQQRYESLEHAPELFLAALASDEMRLEGDDSRWRFLSLARLLGAWGDSADDLARLLALEASSIVQAWDEVISGVFAESGTPEAKTLAAVDQKFLGRVVTRRMERDLGELGLLRWSGVTSGGGLPIVQAWRPARGEGDDRCFMAEVRWWGTKPGGELRFGVDFWTKDRQAEDEEIRRAAYDLALSMDSIIDSTALKNALSADRSELAGLISRQGSGRPKAKGDWDQVVAHGFQGAPLPGGRRNTRQATKPAFYGDGTLRYQAITSVAFEQASAVDVLDLMKATLDYLVESQP